MKVGTGQMQWHRRSARLYRLEEGVEQMHCVAARRGGPLFANRRESAIPLKG